MLESTVAVVARSVDEVLRLAKSDNELYATFYQQTESGSRLPDDNEWDILRACADDALFPGYKKEIRFGSLSVDGLGISRYGDCYLVLANDMIEHRTTVFEENSAVFMKTQGVSFANVNSLPRGYRCEWNRRAELGSAKLVPALKAGMTQMEIASLISREGTSPDEDQFIEVHVFGPFTRRSLTTLVTTNMESSGTEIAILRQALEPIGVLVDVR